MSIHQLSPLQGDGVVTSGAGVVALPPVTAGGMAVVVVGGGRGVIVTLLALNSPLSSSAESLPRISPAARAASCARSQAGSGRRRSGRTCSARHHHIISPAAHMQPTELNRRDLSLPQFNRKHNSCYTSLLATANARRHPEVIRSSSRATIIHRLPMALTAAAGISNYI